jgi:hypothetical protein
MQMQQTLNVNELSDNIVFFIWKKLLDNIHLILDSLHSIFGSGNGK